MRKEISVNTTSGFTLNGFCWASEGVLNTNIAIILVHGMAEHIERYDQFATFLSENGYPVYGYDQRGHKLSITEHYDYGYMSDKNNFSILVSDLFEFIDYVKFNEPGKKILVFGHSMGSFVTQRAIQLNNSDFDYAILCGIGFNQTPLLTVASLICSSIILFKGRKFKSQFIDRLAFKTYNNKISKPLSQYDWLSSDPLEVQKYIDDKYCGGVFTVSFFKDFFDGMKKNKKNLKRSKNEIPIFFISGSEDPVGRYGSAVTKLTNKMKKNGYDNISLKLYPDCRHELINEKNKLVIFKDLLEWIKLLN